MKFYIFIVAVFASFSSWASTSVMETTLSTYKNWWINGFSLASVEAEPVQDGGASLSSYNYMSFNYRVGDGQHVAFRVPFTYNSAGFDSFNGDEVQKQSLDLADLLVDFTDSATLLPFEIETFSRLRFELPTSKFSRYQRKIGGLRLDLIMSKNLARNLEIEYWPILTWNLNTLTVYENPEINNSLSHTKQYELNQRLTLWYRVNGDFSVGWFAGTEDVWLNSSKANNTRRQREGRLGEHLLKTGPAVRYSLNRNLNFIFNVSNSVPMWGYTADRTGRMSDLGQFKPNQTEFVLLTFITI